MSEIVVPDVVGEIVAYRAWKVIGTKRMPLLGSVTHGGTVWHPDRWTVATCNGKTHCWKCVDKRVPGEGCTCGLYAARDRRHLSGMGYNKESASRPNPVVIGEVGLVGKVIPGSQGYRAEKGRVVRLFVPFHQWEWIEPLEALYDVPALPDNVLNATPTFPEEVS